MTRITRTLWLTCLLAPCTAFTAPFLPLVPRHARHTHAPGPCNLPFRHLALERSQHSGVREMLASNAPDPMSVTSALVAFGHYSSFVATFGLLTAERILVKEDITVEEATKLSFIDGAYGIAGLGVIATGYLRATQYAKGWPFYAHSPFFYGKMLALGIMGGLSLYPTITFIKWLVAGRKLEDQTAPLPCLEERVVKRLRFFTQHEIYAFFCIPFCAAMMARGIGYTESFPMWAMATGAIVPTAGACAYSVKAALADTSAWEEAVAKQLAQGEATAGEN